MLYWVVGRGGLLGSHVCAALRADPDSVEWHAPRLAWHQPALLEEQIRSSTAGFAASAAASRGDCWALLWCAGPSVVGSSAELLDAETATFSRFLDALGAALRHAPPGKPGLIFLASSAGGVFAGNPSRPLSETSSCHPISAYGEAKLAQERVLDRWAEGQAEVATLVGRISNLYGPGQNLGKSQGLISRLALGCLHHQPIHIFVPLDTRRDFIFVDDCARLVALCMARLRSEAVARQPARLVKIMASEQGTSIAELLGIFQRLTRQRPRVVLAPSRASMEQPRDLRFRSGVWRDLRPSAPTSLLVGIHRVYADHLAIYRGGHLPQRVAH
jgi:UDP-glucose 4-epimerase